MRVVATAGHVDHGKSTLVEALTGTDPDRFPEEKSRGLTIDLGFAFFDLPGGETVGFVDVPGHVRFVKNMLAGVGAVDVALLVVDASEGWMPQSAEHVEILDLLGVSQGLVVVTKADLVDTETLEVAQLELAEHLEGTTLESWPVVVVDSVSRRGLDRLVAMLAETLASAAAPVDRGRPRLWIDRVFAPKGAGTVVTGTLTGGGFEVDDDVVVEPGGIAARIRAIESGGERIASVKPGARVALNLTGVGHRDLGRGMAVVRPDQWSTTTSIDVSLAVVDPEPVAARGTMHVYVGSGEHQSRYRILDENTRLARLRLPEPLPLAPGDRLVLRSSARRRNFAGAEVLDVEPAPRTADALTRLSKPLAARILDAHPWITTAELGRRAGVGDTAASELGRSLVESGLAIAVGEWLVATDALDDLRNQVATRVARHHDLHPLDAGAPLAELANEMGVSSPMVRAVVEASENLVVDRDVVRDASHVSDPATDPGATAWLDALRESPFSPPPPEAAGVSPSLVRALARAGLVEQIDDLWFGSDALASARRIASVEVLARGSLTVSELRDIFASTRKYVVPLAGYLDAQGITRRRGDERVPGPRAADPQ